MKIFGTVYPFVERDESSFKIGRQVANLDFLRALLIYSDFDEYHLFCMSPDHAAWTEKRLNREGLLTDEVKIRTYTQLPESLRDVEYHVFHLGGWGYFMAGLAHLRQRYATKSFPITGIIHSMNGIETNFHAVKVSMAPLGVSDSIVCTSQAGKTVLEKTLQGVGAALGEYGTRAAYRGRADVIPLAVADDFTAPEKGSCRELLGVPEEAFVSLVLGRFSPKTKMDLYPVLQCQARLAQAKAAGDRPVVMILAGSGSPKEIKVVRQMIAELGVGETVKVVSNFEDPMKLRLYGAADVYVSLSDNIQETFGISVVEAMMCSLPSVVTDIDGYKELIVDGEHGYKIPTTWIDELDQAALAEIQDFETMQLVLAGCMAADGEVLFERMASLASNKQLCRTLGGAARKRAMERYTWSKVMGRYTALWDELKGIEVHPAEERTINPFINEYLRTFSHYPTRVIHDGLVCRITSAGRQSLSEGLPARYSEVDAGLDEEYLRKVLAELSEDSLKVEDLMATAGGNYPRDRARYGLLWMAKYGLITIRES